MRNLLTWAVALAIVPLAVAIHAAQTRTPSKKTSSSKASASRNSKASKSSTTKSTKTASRKGKKSSKPAVTWRNRQLAPTAHRYKEIQSALVAKGYLQAESVTGEWNQASIDALKRFQADQNLEVNGKLNSLSLIALGLGPKYEAKSLPPPPAQAEAFPAN